MRLREFIPVGAKEYCRLIRAKLCFRSSFIGSPSVSCRAKIGRGCQITKGVELNDDVAIGDYSYVNPFTMIGSGSIGKYCSIGYFCHIGMPGHPLKYVSSSPFTYGRSNIFAAQREWNDFPSPPEIGHDVWIGSGVHVLQGVRIGSGAVIGAGAVVTRDVPDYAVAAGVPARVVRMRFDDETVEKLLQWRWWDLEVTQLVHFRHLFGNERWTAGDIAAAAESRSYKLPRGR